MIKKFIPAVLIIFLFNATQARAQEADSASMTKSQKNIQNNLKEEDKTQHRINKKQNRIDKEQKAINRQERKKEKRMKRIEKEQKQYNKAATPQ